MLWSALAATCYTVLCLCLTLLYCLCDNTVENLTQTTVKASVRYLDTTKLVDDPLIGSSVRLQVIRKGHLAVFTSRVTRRCAPFQSLLGVLSSSYYWPASLLLFGHLTNAMNPGQMLCDVVEKFANEWIPLECSVTLMWFFVLPYIVSSWGVPFIAAARCLFCTII